MRKFTDLAALKKDGFFTFSVSSGGSYRKLAIKIPQNAIDRTKDSKYYIIKIKFINIFLSYSERWRYKDL